MNPTGFDDDGAPVPITGFDFDALDAEEQVATAPAITGQGWCEGLTDCLRLLTAGRRPGRAGATAAGRDVAILAHVILNSGETQEALARRLGASPALVSAKVNHARRTLAALSKAKTGIAARETESREHR